MNRASHRFDQTGLHVRTGRAAGRALSVAALTVNPGLGGRRFPARTVKMKRAAHAGIQAGPRRSTTLDEARARLAALPAGFTDWVWSEPALPERVADLLGPSEADPAG
ncbi:hypothetical protein [Methylobacterium sp. SD21]|uniref:hypothetical protein n=1 Tax=Methylobacterium litchii TaxID=3138810 RepID=UPI00313ED601